MSSARPDELPLFPLGLVLLPGELLPLHIFEERYKGMIRHCRDTGEPFGLVWKQLDELAEVACTARLRVVLREYEDGRLDVVVRGEERFRLLAAIVPEEIDLEPLRAEVEFLEEEGPEPPEELKAEAVRMFGEVVRLAEVEGEPPELATEVSLSYAIASRLELEPALKLGLLVMDQETERLNYLLDVLRTVSGRLELLKERKEAIRGNGDAR